MKVLVAKNGSLVGNTYPLGGRTLIGRGGECDIQLTDSLASRRHACVLELDDGTILLRDLKSQNGTTLRGEQVTEATLEPGDVIRIGETDFELRIPRTAQESMPPADVELRLTSGPATQSTVSTRLTPEQRAQIARAAASRTGGEEVLTLASCCDSPLAERAREEGWPHCPACGGKPG